MADLRVGHDEVQNGMLNDDLVMARILRVLGLGVGYFVLSGLLDATRRQRSYRSTSYGRSTGVVQFAEEVAMDLSVGVLVVGSLLWDGKDHRKSWRCRHLNLLKKRSVRVPIRYGRRANSRGNTYTMMFAPDLEATNQMGTAVVLPCLKRICNSQDLIDEAEALWAAEQKELTPSGPVSASWGSVGLLQNPARDVPENLLLAWKDRVIREKYYGKLRVPTSSIPPIGPDGKLAVPWPEPVSDDGEPEVDLLLATATGLRKPDTEYPSAQTIANAWNCVDPEHAKYFFNNHDNDIRTFEDLEIKSLLPNRE